MITRENFKWRTGYGQVKKIDEIDDDHLANIVLHTSVRYPEHYGPEMKAFLKDELFRRGLKPKTVELPHRDDGGGWAMWDPELRSMQMISEEDTLKQLVKFFRSTVHYRMRIA